MHDDDDSTRKKRRRSKSSNGAAAAAGGLLAAMLLAALAAGAAMPATTTMVQRAYAQKPSSFTIDGAGATFPFPLIDTWRVEYKKVAPAVNLNYASIGSGGGIKQFTALTIDFGASDAPLSQAQRDALPAPAVHIPETIGSVVAAYNVPGINQKGLKLSGPVLADIFLGKITRWDDPRIKSLNPDLPLPSHDIVVVRRSDGSGTTFVWTDYLSKVSPEWDEKVGKGTSVPWPTGRGAPGNEGVATTIRGAMYSLGYVELSYALTTGMNYAYIQNRAGNFIEPTIASTRAAVEASAGSLPAGDESWEQVSLVNAPGEQSYPIASFSYLLLYRDMGANPKVDSAAKAKAIVDFVAWAVSPEGQKYAEKLSYVPLPEEVTKLNQKTLATLTYNGQHLYSSSPLPPSPVQEQQPAAPPQKGEGAGQQAGPLQTAKKEYKAKLAAVASISGGDRLSVLVKNPRASDAQVYKVQITLGASEDTPIVIGSVKAPRGWTGDFDGSVATFSTEKSPLKAGKSGLFRVTLASGDDGGAGAAPARAGWEAYDAAGNAIKSGTAKVRVRS